MQIGFLLKTFLKAGREVMEYARPMVRFEQVGMLLAGDQAAYLKSIAFECALQERLGGGREISEERVVEILNTPDRTYCGNMSPIQFVERGYKGGMDHAVLALRQAIRREAGTALPDMSASELKRLRIEELRP